MLEELKKKTIQKSVVLVIILFVAGALLIFMEFSNVKSLLHGREVFESLAPDEINENLIVDASINANFGAFMEEYETNTKTHVSRTTYLYYVIWTGDEYAEDFKYMGIKVPASDEAVMEAMAEAAYNEEYSEAVSYSGAVNKMTSEEYEYFQEFFTDAGWSEKDVEEYTLPYYISVGALTGGAAVAAYVFMAVGIVLVLAALLRLVYVLKGGSLKAIRREMEAISLTGEQVDYEYQSAKLMNKSSDLRLGRRLIFFIAGNKPHVIPNTKLVWIYQKNVTHRTNGIKTGTTYEIILNTYEKQTFSVPISDESTGQELLGYINDTLPWIVTGYNAELDKMYRKDYENFLQIRYQQVPHETYEFETSDFAAMKPKSE